MDILKKLADQSAFAPAEWQVCCYILDHRDLVCDLSLRELAAASFTSAPTILRVIRKCHLSGYQDLKKELIIASENEKQRSQHRNIDVSMPFSERNTATAISGKMKSLYMETIESASRLTDLKVLSQIALRIRKARRVFIYAYGDSALCAAMFMNKLSKLNIYCIDASKNSQEVQESRNLNKEDYAVFLSYRLRNPQFEKCAAVFRNNRVPFAVITSSTDHPVAETCTDLIALPPGLKDHSISGFYSQIAEEFVLNLLYSLIFQQDYARFEAHKRLIDQAE